MSCHHNESCYSPVTVTENRFFLNGEPWVLTREADLPVYVERQAESPKPSSPTLDHASTQPFPDRRRHALLFRSSSEREDHLKKIELDLPAASHHNWQRTPELESPFPIQPQVLKTSQETSTYAGTGSCKRLHLSHPHLCKKIVQKARRALSKLGRKSIPAALHEDSISFANSSQDANVRPDWSIETAPTELPAVGNTFHELLAVAADSPAVHEAPGDSFVRREPKEIDFGSYPDISSPHTPFPWYSGSGSTVSAWSQKPWQISSSTGFTSNSDFPDLMSPTRRPSELEGSTSSPSLLSVSTPAVDVSRILPVIGENALRQTGAIPAGTSHWSELDASVSVAQEPVFCQKQSLEDSFMGDCDLCDSPTSLFTPDRVADQLIEANRIRELGSRDGDSYKSPVHESKVTPSSSEDVVIRETPCRRTSTVSAWSTSDSETSDDCHLIIPRCPCHELPMRPDMDLSTLVAGAKSCGVSSHLLVQGDQGTLGGRIQSMFNLLLELALQKLEKLDAFEPEVRSVMAPAFKTLPSFQAGLKALHHLHTSQSLPYIQELVSLVFMAFSITILDIGERHLSQYAGVLYIDIASWTDVLTSSADKQAFGTFLEVLWLPQVRSPTAPFREGQFCPFTYPKRLSTQGGSSPPLSSHLGLRTGMAARVCQYYVDLMHHAAENEVASGSHPADHLLAKDLPPSFEDSVMADVMQPHLDLPMKEEMREVVSSTVEALRNGKLSSFHQVDSHFTSGILERRGHFGTVSSSISRIFAMRCQNAAAMFDCRKVKWLMKILEDSASWVVSQKWAESVDIPSGRASALTQTNNKSVYAHSQLRLDNPRVVRRTDRQKNLSQDILPLKCTKCEQIFRGKYRQDHLRRHTKFTHGNHYTTCNLCGIRLKDRSDNVGKHLRVVHELHVAPIGRSRRHRSR